MGFLSKLFGGGKGGFLNPINHLNPKNHLNPRNHLDPAGLFGGQQSNSQFAPRPQFGRRPLFEPQNPLGGLAQPGVQAWRERIGPEQGFQPWQEGQMPWGGRLGSLYQQQMEDYGMRGSSYGPRYIP